MHNFFTRSPKGLFDDAVRFLHEHRSDWGHLHAYPEVLTNKEMMERILRDPSPYDRIPRLPNLKAAIEAKLQQVLEEQRQQYAPQIEAILQHVESVAYRYGESEPAHQLILDATRDIEAYLNRLKTEPQFGALASYVTYARERDERLRKELENIQKPEVSPPGGQHHGPGERQQVVITVQGSPARLLPGGEVRLETPEQLEDYLLRLKQTLGALLRDGVVIIRGQ